MSYYSFSFFYCILIIYRIFTFCVLPFVFLFLLFSSKRQVKFSKLLEHLSIFSLPLLYPSSIWITASSMGEVLVAIDLLPLLKKHHKNIIITTNDYDSFKKLEPHLGENIYHLFLPLDNFFIIKNFIKKIKPVLFITLEREIFPETLWQVKLSNAKLIIINGRLSNKSSQLYKKNHIFFSYLYSLYDQILVQYTLDYKNYAKFTTKDKIQITGNLKVIRTLGEIQPLPLKKTNLSKEKPIICFGSIRDGEEELIIRVCKKILHQMDCTFILAPRYLRQIENITSKLEDFYLISHLIEAKEDIQDKNYLILDSIGNLTSAYAISNLVITCGSFIKKYGGHNIIEPILLDKPTIIGNYYRNFQTIVDELNQNNGIVITNADNLTTEIISLLNSKEKSQLLVKNATKIIKKYQTAKEDTLEVISKMLGT